MLNKLQINSLVTSVLLLPAIALNAYTADTHTLDFMFSNSISYPVWELDLFSNQIDK